MILTRDLLLTSHASDGYDIGSYNNGSPDGSFDDGGLIARKHNNGSETKDQMTRDETTMDHTTVV